MCTIWYSAFKQVNTMGKNSIMNFPLKSTFKSKRKASNVIYTDQKPIQSKAHRKLEIGCVLWQNSSICFSFFFWPIDILGCVFISYIINSLRFIVFTKWFARIVKKNRKRITRAYTIIITFCVYKYNFLRFFYYKKLQKRELFNLIVNSICKWNEYGAKWK